MAVIFCETSNPTKCVIDEPPTVRITGRHRPDRGTIGGSGAARDYRMSTYGNCRIDFIAKRVALMVSDGGKTCRGRLALMTNRPNKHEASASATGYLFQCRYALLVGLQAIADAPQLQISIEKLDDIGFEEHGEPVQLIQTKHHLKKTGNLANASVDLWKTLHIWIKLATQDVEVPFRVRLVLLTTAAATEGAAAGYLRVRDRDEAK